MEVRSLHRYARISPHKARDVAREIQGMPVSVALDVLSFTPRKAALLIGKTLKSALANAENNHELAVDGLVVKEAVVDVGPTLKRFKPRARGSAGPIRKRTSHIRIVLTDEPVAGRKEKKSEKKADLKQGAGKTTGDAAASEQA
ncbi:MAG: 50S ribosomal protein L22 [Verrucomicrobiaceae bacterium]|nr:50S ribosomal protein L22 [Verrucomicrobiaceae bacterium]